VQRVRAKFDLPDRFVLYLGINKPHKNLVALVEAWAQVETDAPLVIAGAWDERYTQVKERAAALGLGARVRFLGPVSNDDQPALYAAATVFVFPSVYEGFGLPVIEAMACGTAVACSSSSSLLEVAREAGMLFNPSQREEIIEVLSRLLSDEVLRDRLQLQGLEKAERYKWEGTAAKTIAIYRSLL
jgi:glycosyltransferase involved in cell wall biosynthesis